jgi:putative sigma-54 modulation protein
VIDAPSYVIAAPEHDPEDEAAAFNPVIIAESTTALHTNHGDINLVYRRADGNVGWIDPPALPAQSG